MPLRPALVAGAPRFARADGLTLVALGGLWGSAFVAIRAGLLAGAPPFLYADLRFVLAALASLALAVGLRVPRPSRQLLLRAALLGGLSLVGGYSILVYWGETTTGGGLSAILVATVPLWSGVVGHRALPGERFGGLGWLGILVGFVGVVLLLLPGLSPGAFGATLGAVAIVGAALLFSGGSVLLRRLGGGPEGLWSLSAQFAAAALVILPFTLASEPLALPVTPLVLGTLLYLALGSSVLGFLLYFRLHHRVGPARASFVTYVSPVAGLLLGALLLGEPVSVLEIGGFALIVLGILLLRREGRRPVAPSSPSPTPSRPS